MRDCTYLRFEASVKVILASSSWAKRKDSFYSLLLDDLKSWMKA